jgi:hypothetical protein
MKTFKKSKFWLCMVLTSVLMVLCQPVSAKNVYVNGVAVNIRLGPGTQYEMIGKVYWADKLKIVGKDTSKNWFRVKTQKGKKGWIYKKLIQSNTPLAYELIQTKSLDIGSNDSFKGAKRAQYDVEVPLPTTDEQVRAIIKMAAKNLANQRTVDALTVHLFLKGTNLPYAIADWAPEGDWEKAEKGKSKSIFRTVVKIFKARRPKKEVARKKGGMSLQKRKKIYREWCVALKKAEDLAYAKYKYDVMEQIDYERVLQNNFKGDIGKKHGITIKQLDSIFIEGEVNFWPAP